MPWRDDLASMAGLISYRATYKIGGFGFGDEIQEESRRVFTWLTGQFLSEIERKVKIQEKYQLNAYIFEKKHGMVVIVGNQEFESNFNMEKFEKVIEEVREIFEGRTEYKTEFFKSWDTAKLTIYLIPQD